MVSEEKKDKINPLERVFTSDQQENERKKKGDGIQEYLVLFDQRHTKRIELKLSVMGIQMTRIGLCGSETGLFRCVTTILNICCR